MSFLSNFPGPEGGLKRTQILNQDGLCSWGWLQWFLSVWTNIRLLDAALSDLPVFANNAAAIAGGLKVGAFYRTGADPDPVCRVH